MNALPWYGGKYYAREWVNGLLGPRSGYRGDIYCEPFFGMGAVLLGREAAPIEVVSDVNGRVVNWWRVLQGRVDELAELVVGTPSSREVFDGCVSGLDEGCELERAWRFHVVVTQGRFVGDGAMSWCPKVGPPWLAGGYADRLRRVAHRVRRVNIESRCGTEVLRWARRKGSAIVYVDPPYWGEADTTGYAADDRVELTELLLEQEGRCGVSGYGDQWDHLGWERFEREQVLRIQQGEGRSNMRTEVLWLNGPAAWRRGGGQLELL